MKESEIALLNTPVSLRLGSLGIDVAGRRLYEDEGLGIVVKRMLYEFLQLREAIVPELQLTPAQAAILVRVFRGQEVHHAYLDAAVRAWWKGIPAKNRTKELTAEVKALTRNLSKLTLAHALVLADMIRLNSIDRPGISPAYKDEAFFTQKDLEILRESPYFNPAPDEALLEALDE